MRYLLLLLSMFIAACDAEHGLVKVEKPVVNQALGGIWVGGEYVLIATEGGQVLWREELGGEIGRFGYGTATVTEATLTASFTLIRVGLPAFPVPPGYDDTLASCVATGTIQERQSMMVSVECTDSDGNEFLSAPDVTLNYWSGYDRESSLATIAGLYDTRFDVPSILDINADGTLFLQDACVTNGQVSIIDPDFNLYAVSVETSNCTDDTAWLNGMSGTGFFFLDNEIQPGTETLIYLGISELDGVRWGVFFYRSRIN